MAVVKAVEKDKFGSERFTVIFDQLGKFKLSKDSQRRLDRINTVFSYRRDVAYALHHLEENNEYGGWRRREEAKERLNSFKPVQFFLDALQTLLDEVRKEEAAKPPPKVRQYNTRRSWG